MATSGYYPGVKFIDLTVKLSSSKKGYKWLIRRNSCTFLKLQSPNDCTKIACLRADGDYSIRQNHCEIQNSSKAKKKNKLTCIYSYSIGNRLVKCDVFVKLSPQCSCTALSEKAELVLYHSYYYLQLTFWRGEERSSVHLKMEC